MGGWGQGGGILGVGGVEATVIIVLVTFWKGVYPLGGRKFFPYRIDLFQKELGVQKKKKKKKKKRN